MEYEQITQEYRDDFLAEAMYAREVEIFHYDFDRLNFMRLLKTLPAGEFREQVEQRLAATEQQLQNAVAVYETLKSRIVDIEAHTAAVARTAARREKQQE